MLILSNIFQTILPQVHANLEQLAVILIMQIVWQLLCLMAGETNCVDVRNVFSCTKPTSSVGLWSYTRGSTQLTTQSSFELQVNGALLQCTWNGPCMILIRLYGSLENLLMIPPSVFWTQKSSCTSAQIWICGELVSELTNEQWLWYHRCDINL